MQKYTLPFIDSKVEISQGYNGPYSHILFRNKNKVSHDDRFSLDFKLDVNTPVRAARDGIVYYLIDIYKEFYEGLDYTEGMKYRSNFIMLKHEDNIFSLYSHLEKHMATCKSGDTVKQGEIISYTGKVGWIGLFPHLHFSVLSINNPHRKTIPIKFSNYNGPLEHSKIFGWKMNYKFYYDIN